MKITTKKKVYTALLTVGLAGLWLDKGFGGASPADASPATAELAPADGAAPGFRSTTTGVSLVSELKGMFSGNFDPQSAHDAFVPAKYWTAACINATTPTHAQTTASEFQRDHRLSALMLSGHGGQAIINGQLVRVGHTIDGFKLVAIGPNRATLLNGEILVELHMESTAATIDSISTR